MRYQNMFHEVYVWCFTRQQDETMIWYNIRDDI